MVTVRRQGAPPFLSMKRDTYASSTGLDAMVVIIEMVLLGWSEGTKCMVLLVVLQEFTGLGKGKKVKKDKQKKEMDARKD